MAGLQTDHKCMFPGGVTVKPDGVHEVDPCVYNLMEEHRNVTVKIWQCPFCKSIDISWERQDDTESEIHRDLED